MFRDRAFALRDIPIRVGHQLGQFLERYLWLPAENAFGFARIAEEQIDFRRAEIAWVNVNELLPIEIKQFKNFIEELANGMRLAGRDYKVVRLDSLQHEPHRLDVITGVSPVALRVEVSKEQLLLQTFLDARRGPGDLAGDKCLAAAWALVVKQDAVHGEHVIRFAIVDRLPETEHLRACIRAARMEGRLLGLRRLNHLAIHLAARCLIDADFGVRIANRFQKIDRAQRIALNSVNRLIK